MKRAIATDSTAAPALLSTAKGIDILPLQIEMTGRIYRDGIDLPSDFPTLLRQSPELYPNTSPPSLEDISGLIERWIIGGIEEAIIVTISSGISKTYNRISQIVREYRSQIRVRVIDSLATGHPQAKMTLEAKSMLEDGYRLEEIEQRLLQMRSNRELYYTVGTTRYLSRHQNFHSMKSTVFSTLGLHPILRLDKVGKFVQTDTVMTLLKATEQVAANIRDFVSTSRYEIYLMHTGDVQGDIFEYNMREIFKDNQVLSAPVSAALICHTGPWFYGAGVYLR